MIDDIQEETSLISATGQQDADSRPYSDEYYSRALPIDPNETNIFSTFAPPPVHSSSANNINEAIISVPTNTTVSVAGELLPQLNISLEDYYNPATAQHSVFNDSLPPDSAYITASVLNQDDAHSHFNSSGSSSVGSYSMASTILAHDDDVPKMHFKEEKEKTDTSSDTANDQTKMEVNVNVYVKSYL